MFNNVAPSLFSTLKKNSWGLLRPQRDAIIKFIFQKCFETNSREIFEGLGSEKTPETSNVSIFETLVRLIDLGKMKKPSIHLWSNLSTLMLYLSVIHSELAGWIEKKCAEQVSNYTQVGNVFTLSERDEVQT